MHATFMSQFPMLLVAIALFMLLVDQGIMTICKSNNSMGNLHKMLEHIADKEKDKNEKTVELLQSFASNSSSNFFVAYVLKAIFGGIVPPYQEIICYDFSLLFWTNSFIVQLGLGFKLITKLTFNTI